MMNCKPLTHNFNQDNVLDKRIIELQRELNSINRVKNKLKPNKGNKRWEHKDVSNVAICRTPGT